MRRVGLFLVVVVAVCTSSARAQSNLGIGGGVLWPIADFDDAADISPYVGARWEFREVNAVGQPSRSSILLHGGFAFLKTDSSLETLLDTPGESDDGSYFDVGIAARVYSSVIPLFVGMGLGYANVDTPGPSDSRSAFLGHAGMGLMFNLWLVRIDIEGRASLVFTEDNDLQHIMVISHIALPFD